MGFGGMKNVVCISKKLKRDGLEKPKPGGALVHAVLISVQICFSGWNVLAKVALNDGVNGVALAMAREACATVLMFIIARRVDGKVALDRTHIMRFVWMGLASFGNVVGSILALEYFSPMAFGVVQPSIPIFAMMLSYFCGLEQMSQLKCVGVLVAVAGAVWVELFSATAAAGGGRRSGGASAESGSAWVGSLILFWQCASMATLLVIQKPMLAAYPSATLTAWYYAVGTAFTMVMCACSGVKLEDFLLTGRIEPWIALVYVVLFGTVYTYNAYSWAVNIVSPTTATVYLTLQPVATVILSGIFLHKIASGHDVLGGAAIIFGLWVTLYAKGLEHKGTAIMLRAKQSRELSRAFKTPGRRIGRRRKGSATAGDQSNSDTDGAMGGLGFDSDQDPLLGGVGGGGGLGGGGYDPREAEDSSGSLRRFMALV